MLASTDEKLGLDDVLLEPDIPLDEPLVLEPPEAALPDDDLSDEPDELPDAAGADDEEPLPDAAGELDEELSATATLDSANSAAAVAALRTLSFSIRISLVGKKDLPPTAMQAPCPGSPVLGR